MNGNTRDAVRAKHRNPVGTPVSKIHGRTLGARVNNLRNAGVYVGNLYNDLIGMDTEIINAVFSDLRDTINEAVNKALEAYDNSPMRKASFAATGQMARQLVVDAIAWAGLGTGFAVTISVAQLEITFEYEPPQYETFYRAMEPQHFTDLVLEGKISSTSETYVATDFNYYAGKQYVGILVEFSMLEGTESQLEQVGVADQSIYNSSRASVRARYAHLPPTFEGWKYTNVQFKRERGYINIGLGVGPGIQVFRNNLVKFNAIGSNNTI